MLSLAQASRLTRQAGRGGWLSRRAWRRLAEAADRGDVVAIEAAWRAWLRNPDYQRWRQLARWRPSAGLVELVCADALSEPAGDAGGPGPLAAFCASHGLTPSDPVRRGVFLLLTSQHAQYRAADPDGSLLALGYAAAAGPERERLRAAMAGTAGLDLIRVVARGAPRGKLAELTAEEAGFLAAQLAGRRDWPGLWELTRNLRVPDAVRAVRMVGDRWHPGPERDEVLFRALAQADPDRLTRAVEALGGFPARDARAARAPGVAVTRTVVLAATSGTPPRSVTGAMSADGRRLAVIAAGESAAGTVLSVFDVPGAGESPAGADEYTLQCPAHRALAAFAGHLPVTSARGVLADWPGTLVRYERGQTVLLAGLRTEPGRPVVGLAPRGAPPGGIAVLCQEHLLLADPDGALTGSVPLPAIPWQGGTRLRPVHLSSIAAGPGGRIAVTGEGGFAVFDTANRAEAGLIAMARLPAGASEIAFCAPDRLVTVTYPEPVVTQRRVARLTADRDLRLWRLDGDRLEQQAARHVQAYLRSPVAVPGHGTLALQDVGSFPDPPAVRYLDAGNLADTGPPAGFATAGAEALCGSADLRSCAVVLGDTIEVHTAAHPAAVVADLPPADWVPGDLTAVSGALRPAAPESAEEPLLTLLRACLEYRLGADVGIEAAPPGAPDDIALAKRPRQGGDLGC